MTSGKICLLTKGRKGNEIPYSSKEGRDVIVAKWRASNHKRFYIQVSPDIDEEEPEPFIREKGEYSNTTPFGIAKET